MKKERTAELMQNQEIEELFGTNMLDDIQKHKKSEANNFRMLNCHAQNGQIVFAGSSLMEWFRIGERQSTLNIDRIIYNRGIAGTTTKELLTTMNECIFDLEPSKIFINIGSMI